MRRRHHIDPLSAPRLSIAPARVPIPPGAAVEVELGSAEAQFLIERAEEAPERFYVGIEIREEWVVEANRAAAARGLTQVHSVFANMNVDLGRVLAPGSVHRFHINFPDPWFKSRQHKRRVMGPALFAELYGLLAQEGEILVATDIWDLALEAMAGLEAEAPRRFVNLREPWTFARQRPFAARSRRERECEAKGMEIWRLGYRRL